MREVILSYFIPLAFSFQLHQLDASTAQQEADDFLQQFDQQAERYQRLQHLALWKYYQHMTPGMQEKLAKLGAIVSDFSNNETLKAERINLQHLGHQIARQIEIIRKTTTPKSKKLAEKLSNSITSMTQIFGNAKVKLCSENDKCRTLSLVPDLTTLMSRSLDYKDRASAWKGFRDVTGPNVKPFFLNYVNISNIGAREHGWRDVGQNWRSEYELGPGELVQMMKSLWVELKPLYEKLHGYVRHMLREIYGLSKVSRRGPIPTHLLYMWGFDWSSLSGLVKPFPHKPDAKITSRMLRKGMTVMDMVRMAEDFYTSIGLEKMLPLFWKKSLFSHKSGEEVDCTISAWDVAPGDYRIKMPCASVNENQFLTVLHEMGHIEYDILYRQQPYAFRGGANPAFHEAVGDAVTLSARVPSYLKTAGLLGNDSTADEDSENSINFLMKQALKNVAILPFAITIDFWRWKAFSGEVKADQYNDEWWKLKREYQGVSAPVVRTKHDFDPGANSHICNNTPYARYFIGAVLQFQFHQAMCNAADHKGPLHKCSIYGSKKAGNKLRAMLRLGRSKPWKDALEAMTGQRSIDAGAINTYFAPLVKWLDEQQRKLEYPIGW